MKTYALCFRSMTRPEDKQFAIHIAGCADLYREEQEYSSNVVLHEAATIQEAVDQIVDEELRGMGYDESSVQIYPCCRKGPVAKKALDPSLCSGTGQRLENPRRAVWLPCPVCGKYVGTGRGTVPRHKPR